MVSLSNYGGDGGGFTGDNSNKRPLENGYVGKYKPRKVSATRDFPPMCGHHNADRVEAAGRSELATPDEVLNSETGNVAGSDGLESKMVDVQSWSLEVVNNAVEVDTDQSLDALVGKVVIMATCDLTNGVETSPRPKDKYRLRRVSAVRDFPPLCGRNSPKLAEQQCQMVTSGNGVQDGVETVEVKMEVAQPLGDGIEARASSDMLNTLQRECSDVMYDADVETKATQALRDGMERGASGEMQISNYRTSEVQETMRAAAEACLLKEKSGSPVEELEGDVQDEVLERTELRGAISPSRFVSRGVPDNSDEDAGAYVGKIYDSGSKPEADTCTEDTGGSVGKEIVVYSPDRTGEMQPSYNQFSSQHEVNREVVRGLMAAHSCPWKKVKADLKDSHGRKSQGRVRRHKAVARKSKPNHSTGSPIKKKPAPLSINVDRSPGAADEEDYSTLLPETSPAIGKRTHFDVSLPPFGPKTTNHGDARNKVRETLRMFHAICRKLLQGEEAKLTPEEEGKPKRHLNRVDLPAAKMIKEKGKEVNANQQVLGDVPGVEVGDEFQYRVELAIVGIHRLYQAGIDSMKHDGVLLATSIVASGGYADDTDNADVLRYSGQGGNIIGKNKQPEDQKLEKGNLALYNCISAGTPVRVIRGWKEPKAPNSLDSKGKIVTTYVYDGLYTVTDCKTEKGPHGKSVFMFELRRNPGQPELAWKELKKSNKFNTRPGVCLPDISAGKEPFPICAVNTLDNEKPPSFNYIAKMMYPDWYHPLPPEGCDCAGRCYSRKCRCAAKNGGEIPYNRNGAIVEVKPLVYECGPHCKCLPSCYNRVSQRGIRFKLEIFKTETRGWGVRSQASIPSGSFICEYAGELLQDTEAEQRIGSDEYLFDIGQNYCDSSVQPELTDSSALADGGGYTIDAAQYGNVGRFINHSCSPNLYAQNVIHDHDDIRMPHVMLFAAENIPPLQELTYHYNYSVDQIRDSDGNIKVKKCYCGSAECTGRLY